MEKAKSTYVPMKYIPRGKVTHQMANGEIRDSVKGYITSDEQIPEPARTILNNMLLGRYMNQEDKIN